MKKKMTKKEAILLNNALIQAMNIPGKKFAYGILKNINLIKKEVIDPIDKDNEPAAMFKEYDTKRIALCETFSKKENGKTVIKNTPQGTQEYQIEADRKAVFEKELKTLQFAYGTTLTERAEQGKKIEKGFNEEIELDLYTIEAADAPESITAKHLIDLDLIIIPEGGQDSAV